MPFDDELGDDESPGSPPPPEARAWRHPSELGAAGEAAPIQFVTRPTPTSRTWLVALTSALVGAAVALSAVVVLGGFRATRTEPGGIEQQQINLEKNPDSSLAIAEKVLPAVARIDARGPAGSVNGTAVTFRSNGYLITTADLIDGADAITVTYPDGTTSAGQLVAADRESDVAVVKIDRSGLPVAVIGRPAGKLQLGEPVLAIDSAAGGAGTPAIPVGQINSLGERIESEDADKALYNMIQTNLRLTSAATGAPLIDTNGAVIGIVTSRGFKAPRPAATAAAAGTTVADVTGAGTRSELPPARFATPIDFARTVADSLIKDKKYPHVWLGVEGRSLTPDQATRLDVTGGVLVQTVTEQSPADQAGLAVGDVVIQVEQTPVGSWDDLVVELRRHRPGDSVTIWYVRNGMRDPAFPTLVERTTPGK